MSLSQKGILDTIPAWSNQEKQLEQERFERLMRQHFSQKSEEKHRIILWMISLCLAFLSFAEAWQMLHTFRKRHF